MPNTQTSVLYQWFQRVWNNGEEAAIDEMFHSDGIAHGITSADAPRGPEGFKVFFRNFNDQFADIKITVDEVIREADFESARCLVQATERNSGTRVSFDGLCMVRIADNKIVEAWNNFNFLDMYQQLGHQLVPVEAYAVQ